MAPRAIENCLSSLLTGRDGCNISPMALYELRLYMRNACGPALLGDVAVIDAADEAAAVAEAQRRVAQLPRHCVGALFDAAGVQCWTQDAPARSGA